MLPSPDSSKHNKMGEYESSIIAASSEDSPMRTAPFIFINVFIGNDCHPSLKTLLTMMKSHAFANALSVPSASTGLGKKNRRSTKLNLRTNFLFGSRQHRQFEQQLFPQPPAHYECSTSKRTFRLLSIIIASVCFLAFQQQPALAVSLPNIITSSPISILNAAASNTATTLSSTTAVSSSYHLTRILFLRLLAIVYTTAFCIAKFQNHGLIGDHGILVIHVPWRNQNDKKSSLLSASNILRHPPHG